MELVDCPADGCGARLPDNDVAAQMAHMQGHHPDVIAKRLEDAGVLARDNESERLLRFEPDAEIRRGPSMLSGVIQRMRLHRAVDSYAVDEIERTLDVLRDNGWSGAITADAAVGELAKGVDRLRETLEPRDDLRPALLDLLSAYSEDKWAASWMGGIEFECYRVGGVWEILGRRIGWPLGYRGEGGWFSWDEFEALATKEERRISEQVRDRDKRDR